MFTYFPSALGFVTTRHGRLRVVPSPIRSDRSGNPAYEIYLASSFRLPNSFRVCPFTSKLRNSLRPPHVPFMPPTLCICAGTEPLPLFCCGVRCAELPSFSPLKFSTISETTPSNLSVSSLMSSGELLSTGYKAFIERELIFPSRLILRLISIRSPLIVSSTFSPFVGFGSFSVLVAGSPDLFKRFKTASILLHFHSGSFL